MYERSYEHQVNANLVPHVHTFWSKSYFTDNIEGDIQKNYFISEIEKNGRYAVPFVKNIDFLLNDRDRPSGMF